LPERLKIKTSKTKKKSSKKTFTNDKKLPLQSHQDGEFKIKLPLRGHNYSNPNKVPKEGFKPSIEKGDVQIH
jgi:hypothetical protein